MRIRDFRPPAPQEGRGPANAPGERGAPMRTPNLERIGRHDLRGSEVKPSGAAGRATESALPRGAVQARMRQSVADANREIMETTRPRPLRVDLSQKAGQSLPVARDLRSADVVQPAPGEDPADLAKRLQETSNPFRKIEI